MEEDFETKVPRKPRTEAQKKATENMLMRLKEKRKMADEALEEMKKAKIKEKAKEIRQAERKPSGRPKNVSEPQHDDLDELAERVSAKLANTKTSNKKKVFVEVSSSDSESSESSESSEEEVIVRKVRREPKREVRRPREERVRHEVDEPKPVFYTTGDRVLDSLFYNRR